MHDGDKILPTDSGSDNYQAIQNHKHMLQKKINHEKFVKIQWENIAKFKHFNQ